MKNENVVAQTSIAAFLLVTVLLFRRVVSPETTAQSYYERGHRIELKRRRSRGATGTNNAIKFKSDKIEAGGPLRWINERTKAYSSCRSGKS